MMPHVVRQQFLHVELQGTEAEGLALQRTLPALCRNRLTPALEAAFARCAPPDRHLVIERLEVDVGKVSMEHLERDLARAVAQGVEQALREQIGRYRTKHPSSEVSLVEKSPAETIDAALIHFLNHGTLPWSFRLPPGKSLEEVVLLSWQDSTAVPDPCRRAAEILGTLAGATARLRLLRQFSPRFLNELLALLSPHMQRDLEEILLTLHKSPAPPPQRSTLKKTLYESCFATLAQGRSSSVEELLAQALRELPARGAEGGAAPPGKRHRPEEMEKRAPRRSGAEPVLGSGEGAGALASAEPGTHETVLRAPTPPAGIEADAREGIYIGNAGVVLLHPFLPLFFETLQLAADDKLLQPERALSLLHFTITGQATTPEYETLLLKVLCNIAPGTSVESEAGITDEERAEAEELLRSVIGHWRALRNTSPDALRGSFLLRPGKLTLCEDDDWLLQVEPQSCDILLNQLPWGISMVKLPWMERMLRVEWRQ